MGEISTKKTVDEQILERLQALEVLLMEQRKEIDSLKKNSVCDSINCNNEAKHHLCNECMSEF